MANNLTRRSPLSGIPAFKDFLNPLFGDLETQLGIQPAWAPAIDVMRGEGEVTIRADVPGFKAEDIKVEVEDDALTISGSMEEESEEEGDNFIRRERRSGSFSRSIALPPNIDRSAIEAVVKDGVCSVTVPVPPESAEKIEITPKTG